MSSEWWKKLEETYHAAHELSGEERSRFLDAACGSDATLRHQIEVLLQQDETPDSLLNTQAIRRRFEGATNAGQLDGTEPRRLLEADVAAVYLNPGNANRDIWLLEIARGVLRRMTVLNLKSKS